MKRTVGAFVLLAGLGGGCISPDAGNKNVGHFGRVGYAKEVKNIQGPMGEPIAIGKNGKAYLPNGKDDGLVQTAGSQNGTDSGVVQASGFHRAINNTPAPPLLNRPGAAAPNYGVPGAVAAVGALPPGAGPMIPALGRSSIQFVGPDNEQIRVTWAGPNGFIEPGLETPARYNFPQGGIYRLKVSKLPDRPGVDLYPTLEVFPATVKSAAYLAHSSVPINFTREDVQQVLAGNFLVKVIYLPDEAFQDLAVAEPTELVSTPLEPGFNPITEAQRRGTILAIVRLGNINLELQNSPALDAPNPYMMPGAVGPMMPGVPAAIPGTVPPGMMPPAVQGPIATPAPSSAANAPPRVLPTTLPNR